MHITYHMNHMNITEKYSSYSKYNSCIQEVRKAGVKILGGFQSTWASKRHLNQKMVLYVKH